MFIIKNEIQFDMAHFLEGYEGKCANVHGHRYRLIAYVVAEDLHREGQLRGMVDDFESVKKALAEIASVFDHKLVLEDTQKGQAVAEAFRKVDPSYEVVFVPYRSTAEEMSRAIFYMLKEQDVNVEQVELFETPTSSCIYRENGYGGI